MYEISGTIKLINDTQTFDSGFTKREFVITTDDKYPQDVKFELIKDRTALLDNRSEGDSVSVGFYIRGNEWNDKYYVSLNAVKIHGGSASGSTSASAPAPAADEDDGDLPF